MSRNFEKLIEYIINSDETNARKLFHQIVVSKSRTIYESMEMEGMHPAEDEEMEESWELDEDFDDLAESLNLEVVEKDMEKSAKTADEVGSGKSGMSKGEHAKSPVPASQTSRLGAKPVETGKGPTPNGFKLEAAPKPQAAAPAKAAKKTAKKKKK